MDLVQIVKDTVQTDWKEILLHSGDESSGVPCPLIGMSAGLSEEYERYEGEFKFFPPQEFIFEAFRYFNFHDTKVVILGLDPYIKTGQAMGLSFSVPPDCAIPPSLRNIYKEIQSDLDPGSGVGPPNGDLRGWAEQGVLLLNCYLTVREGHTGSHKKYWKKWSNNLIKYISDNLTGVIFILWGNDARDKLEFIDERRHHVLQGVHPSPLSASRGFFGCKHFSRCNELLIEMGKTPIRFT
jgi:uracil-DNA glycosylase